MHIFTKLHLLFIRQDEIEQYICYYNYKREIERRNNGPQTENGLSSHTRAFINTFKVHPSNR